MITLSLLQYLEDNGFGVVDENLFWQKLSLQKKGVFISSIGQATDRGRRKVQSYQIFSRGVNDIQGYEQLQAIADFLNESYDTCSLPKCPLVSSSKDFQNVTIMPVSTITNNGEDANGTIIWSLTGNIIY